MGLITGMLGGGIGAIGAALSVPDKVKVPQFKQVQSEAIEEQGIKDVQQNLANAGKVTAEASMLSAKQLNALQDYAIPGGRNIATSNILDLMQGKLPASVERSLVSSAAAGALSRGFGGQGFQGTYTNLLRGRGALEAMQLGQNMYSNYMQPYMQKTVDPMSMFLNPQQRVGLAQWNSEQQYQRDLLAAQINAQPSTNAMRWGAALSAFGGSMAGAGGSSGGGMGGGILGLI